MCTCVDIICSITDVFRVVYIHQHNIYVKKKSSKQIEWIIKQGCPCQHLGRGKKLGFSEEFSADKPKSLLKALVFEVCLILMRKGSYKFVRKRETMRQGLWAKFWFQKKSTNPYFQTLMTADWMYKMMLRSIKFQRNNLFFLH